MNIIKPTVIYVPFAGDTIKVTAMSMADVTSRGWLLDMERDTMRGAGLEAKKNPLDATIEFGDKVITNVEAPDTLGEGFTDAPREDWLKLLPDYVKFEVASYFSRVAATNNDGETTETLTSRLTTAEKNV